MPDKMSQYHWLKIKSIFQIYCTAGTWKPPALVLSFSMVWISLLCCGGSGVWWLGWGTRPCLGADSAAMGLPVRVCPKWALCYKNNLIITLITGHRTPPPAFIFCFVQGSTNSAQTEQHPAAYLHLGPSPSRTGSCLLAIYKCFLFSSAAAI